MGTVSSFAEADKFACREWAIGYTSGSISPTGAYRNQKFQRSNER
jgi:hypothetical protein